MMTAPPFEHYLSHLEDCDMSKDDKLLLIRTCYTIIENFIDRAFGEDIAQMMPVGVAKSPKVDFIPVATKQGTSSTQ